MTVTQIEAMFGSKSKYRVYLDGQPAFVYTKASCPTIIYGKDIPGRKEYGISVTCS